MECNKDEAVRAITIAEGKFEKKDYAGAKKFALKAHSLYPRLEGISQMLATLGVYISAENKISGEVDWYGILGVNPSADDETVRKQYRKLVLMLHPDKNKSIGADGAFKLISEAWSLLSDKSKRLAYNQRRSLKGYQQNVQTHTGGPSATPRANGFHNFTSQTASVQQAQKRTAQVPPKTVPVFHKKTVTFWTICHRCKMHYEYLKVYLNHTLLCPNCHEAFLASETAPPFNYSSSANSAACQQQKGSNVRSASHNSVDQAARHNSFTNANLQQSQPPRTAGVSSMDPSIAEKAANVVQLARERMKREHDARHVFSSLSKEEAPLKKSRLDDNGYHFGGIMAYQTTMGNNGFGSAFASGSTKGGFEASRVHGFPRTYSKPNSTRDLTPVELRIMLMDKGRSEVLKKLNEWRSMTAAKTTDTEKEKMKETKQNKEKMKETKQNKERSILKGQDSNGIDEATGIKKSYKAKNPQFSASGDANKEYPVEEPMSVPDSDFHDFDLNKTENCFGENEVWAAYDDDDGMPRFYALIHKVISRKPFKLRISWLNSRTNSEFAPIDWLGSGFYKTCGEFRVGRYENFKAINSFSQKVKWSKGPRGAVHIFPKKGDVWALYRNWSPDWNEHTPDEVIHKYEMMFVLDEYNEEEGVLVTPLVKVAGFRTIFKPQMDPEKIIRVPKEEMFRFSHQVPNYLLTGEEAQNAPKGCQELDPAAVPEELLLPATEDKEEQMVKNDENTNVTESQNIT